jgi:hypothetical protein
MKKETANAIRLALKLPQQIPWLAAHYLRCRGNSVPCRKGSGLYAIQASTHESIRWLQKVPHSDSRLSRAHIAAEPDFDPIRNDPEFIAFLSSLPTQ